MRILVRMSKQAVNLSVDSELLREARANGLNLSAELESYLRTRLKQVQKAVWLTENQQAIQEFRDGVDKDGLWHRGMTPWY